MSPTSARRSTHPCRSLYLFRKVVCFVGETVVVKKLVKRNWEKVSEIETPVGERLGWLSVVAFDVKRLGPDVADHPWRSWLGLERRGVLVMILVVGGATLGDGQGICGRVAHPWR